MVQCNFDTLMCQQKQIIQQMEYENKIDSSMTLKSLARSGTIIHLFTSTYIYHHIFMNYIAFISYVRAYMAYPADMKSIFQRQQLHLGHIAKSFGLREVPTTISRRTKGAAHTKKKWRHYSTKKHILKRKRVFEY